MIPDSGQFFGPYEILGHLGAGGMGTVLRAYDPRLHREVAIKMLRGEFEMPGMRDRFLREARAASALNHPHIATIFDIGEQSGEPYMVMELLEGETVRDRILRGGCTIEEIVTIGAQCAEALADAHAKGIVHRDIKPANIFLVRKNSGQIHVKILDFGLAKVESSESSRSRMDLTSSGATVGTVAYMSPEQARGELLDARSDIFSLGVVLYEMATGQVPFSGATSAIVFVGLLSRDPEPIRDWNKSIPKDLEKVVFKALAKDRLDRYQKAHELQRALEPITGKKGWFGGRSSAPTYEAREPNNDPVARDRRAVKRRSASLLSVTRQDVRPPGTTIPAAAPAPAGSSATAVESGSQPAIPVAGEHPGSSTIERSATLADSGARPQQAEVSGISASPSSVEMPAAKPVSTGQVFTYTDPNRTVTAEQEDEEEFETPRRQRKVFADSATRRRLAAATRRETPGDRRRRKQRVGYSIMASLVFVGMVCALWLHAGHHMAAPLSSGDDLLVGIIENKTQNPLLDHSIRQAVAIELRQSPYINVLSDNQLAGGLAVAQSAVEDPSTVTLTQENIQPIAVIFGAKAYLTGSIEQAGTAFTLQLNAIDSQGAGTLASVTESSPDADHLLDAVDRAVMKLRSALGEPDASIQQNHTPFQQEATASLQALASFSEGEIAMAEDHPLVAIPLYQSALAADPNFALATMRLAEASSTINADGDAMTYAARAASLTGSVGAKQKLFIAFTNDLYSGQWQKASDDLGLLQNIAPHDPDVSLRQGILNTIEGNFSDAMNYAEQANGDYPYTGSAYANAGNALIGLDRYEAAQQMEIQAEHHGFPQPGLLLAAAYLEGKQDIVDMQAKTISSGTGMAGKMNYGLYLDNTGQWRSAQQAWQNAAALAQQQKLPDVAANLLAQGAFDRAVAGQCSGTEEMAQSAVAQLGGKTQPSPKTQYYAAMTSAMCGTPDAARSMAKALGDAYPNSIPVQQLYVPEIQAAAAIKSGDMPGALQYLDTVRQYELISIVPYLRGMAHLQSNQAQLAIGDFQQVLEHRGAAYLTRSPIYALAQAGLGRSFAALGDANNSAPAYKAFLDNWKYADADQPLILEARAHAK
ncbi:MAG TPA: protein kinase [Acidobacteriaceae bacterium]|nr:protein kinase [Acidobacteriaceae bacterium]